MVLESSPTSGMRTFPNAPYIANEKGNVIVVEASRSVVRNETFSTDADDCEILHILFCWKPVGFSRKVKNLMDLSNTYIFQFFIGYYKN